MPGPSSTERGCLVLSTGSPTVRPAELGEYLTCILVALNIGGVTVQLDDFADQFVVADFDQLVHLGSGHSLGNDDYVKSNSYEGLRP